MLVLNMLDMTHNYHKLSYIILKSKASFWRILLYLGFCNAFFEGFLVSFFSKSFGFCLLGKDEDYGKFVTVLRSMKLFLRFRSFYWLRFIHNAWLVSFSLLIFYIQPKFFRMPLQTFLFLPPVILILLP